MITLPNNKLILNGHRILDMNQLFEVKSKSDIEDILKNYENLNIAVRHADTFLKDETSAKHDEIIVLLEKFGTVKQTGKKKL